jgi:ATPase subunit of ABC transporter with duplicated ATPase domains
LYQLLQPLVDAGEQQLRQQSRSRPPPPSQQQLKGLEPAQALQQQQHEEEDPDLGNAVAAEEAAVDALLQQHMSSAAAAAEAALDSEDDSAGSFLNPTAADVSSLEVVQSGDDIQSAGISSQDDNGAKGPLRLAILGLPNVGKSTLMNTLLGYERSLTGGWDVCGEGGALGINMNRRELCRCLASAKAC